MIAFAEELDAWTATRPLRFIDQIAELNVKIAALEAENASFKQQLAEARTAAKEPHPRLTHV